MATEISTLKGWYHGQVTASLASYFHFKCDRIPGPDNPVPMAHSFTPHRYCGPFSVYLLIAKFTSYSYIPLNWHQKQITIFLLRKLRNLVSMNKKIEFCWWLEVCNVRGPIGPRARPFLDGFSTGRTLNGSDF